MLPTTQLISKAGYKKLLADLRQIIGAGKQEAERAAAQALLESYWSIGQRITQEKLATRANFHNAILADPPPTSPPTSAPSSAPSPSTKPTAARRRSKA